MYNNGWLHGDYYLTEYLFVQNITIKIMRDELGYNR